MMTIKKKTLGCPILLAYAKSVDIERLLNIKSLKRSLLKVTKCDRLFDRFETLSADIRAIEVSFLN